ncbi:unnamed protein product [Mytilus edulis]|uniref:DZIP3-like HEPN domain-containing protein n=1 Tax=Mytilus edulis TaxID=6550 RepID=A0A8S3SLT0_MYTED|nr:unnamed protein product [Mytilus edulis]
MFDKNIAAINQPVNGFDNLPPPSEKTPAANIARIKYFRNKLAHSDNDKINQCDFNTFWTELSEAVVRLGGSCLQKRCDAIKDLKITSSVEIDTLKEQITCLKDELKEDIEKLRDDVEQLKTDKMRVSELDNLYHDCKEGKYKFSALLLLVVCNNQLEKKVLEDTTSLFVRGMFVMDVNDLTTDNPCGIILDHEHLKEFFERIFRDMTKSDDIRDYISKCRCCRNERFRTELRTYMLKLSRDTIQELINSASSCFVQLMFIMKEKDIKESVYSSKSFHQSYGIVIPKDDISMYLERVCNEMKSCSDVVSYISELRCSRNVDFNNALNRFMNDRPFIRIEELKKLHGSAWGEKIKHLIEFASQDFIDRLCVLTVEEIKDNSKLEFEQYGVVIPEDYRRLYIARVFDALKKSDTTENYLKHNRNNQTKTFQTSLRSFIEQLQEDEIRNLIQTASSNFLNKWNTRCMFTDISQVPILKITGLIETASVQTLQQMIIVDVKNELEEEQLDYHSPDHSVQNILKVKRNVTPVQIMLKNT